MEDTSGVEPVQPEKSQRLPEKPAPLSAADQSPEPERASGSVDDTVDLVVVQASTSETPPDDPESAPQNQPITQRVDPPQAEPKRRWGSLLSSDRAQLVLREEGAEHLLRVVVQERVVLGRAHPQSGFIPDVDLTPFGAHLKGVSREHVAITFRDHLLQVEDLRSMNGSLLNGWVLMPYESRVLRDGDQLSLGQLVLYVTVIMD